MVFDVDFASAEEEFEKSLRRGIFYSIEMLLIKLSYP